MCFPNAPGSVCLVRRFVGLVAEAYGVAHVGETAALLVSELAGNATVHACAGAGGRFEVVVNRRDEFLRVEVRDDSPELPVMGYSDVLAESGRGLFLVAQLADGHGTFRLPGGKSVWFEVLAWDAGLERRWP
jgi:anti-sigma regulatory factor (Ser/Thr protein kinase)